MPATMRGRSAISGVISVFPLLLLFCLSSASSPWSLSGSETVINTELSRASTKVPEEDFIQDKREAGSTETVFLRTGRAGPCRAGHCPTEELSRVNALKLPAILPHVAGKSSALIPRVLIGRKREPVQLIIGVPTVQRATHNYVNQTLESLLESMQEHEKSSVIVVLMIADIGNFTRADSFIAELQETFAGYIAAGMLVLIAPSPDYYPDFDSIQPTLGDSPDRMKWRTKQTLDFAYLMMYCQTLGTYYLQLEDDIVTKPGYVTKMQNFIAGHERDAFVILEFASLGFIAKLFKTTDLASFIEFILMFYATKPVDWLLESYLSVAMCGEAHTALCAEQMKNAVFRHKPALFQHVGLESSLKGKVQLLKEDDYDDKA